MIGVIIIGHSNISKEFLIALEHIVGKQQNMMAISIQPDDDIKNKRKEIIEAVKNVDNGKGVVILTDMFGGTPSNLAISIMEDEKIEVVAGVNLPMLIKISSLRGECNLKDLIRVSQESGRKYMNVASAFFGESESCKKKD